jgi:hypothetical protein
METNGGRLSVKRKSLGILVSSTQHMDTVIALCRSAQKKGVEVSIFITHLGARLTQDMRFEKLRDLAKMSLCNVSFESLGLRPPVPGIDAKDFATQARHAELIEECDRYVVF